MTQPGPDKGTNARYQKSDNLESSSLAGKIHLVDKKSCLVAT